ncbi:hypothetical protein DPMN_039339 [Dreissena polymorpha]|uniref:Uncharacterized protein n=1 Tax=Dreissena polymorpha TaxID=45954 RepID=A0A9D4RPG6_DREPO|nr:hypothetical protein DPMN_039339 [Dreissena polymorpha]
MLPGHCRGITRNSNSQILEANAVSGLASSRNSNPGNRSIQRLPIAVRNHQSEEKGMNL